MNNSISESEGVYGMGFLDFFRKKDESKKTCSAVILAAGSSERMGFDKLFCMLEEKPVLARTILAFEQSPNVDEIVLVTKAEQIERLADLCREYGFQKVTAVVCGGKTRMESALAGVSAVSTDADWIAVHDGARPFVTEELIQRILEAAIQYYAAVPVIKSTDTLKLIQKDGSISGTVDRDAVVRVQTPQIFSADLLKGALSDAVAKGLLYTDDSAAVERMGIQVQTVEGSEDNIKLTRPMDLEIAMMIAEQEKMQ